MSGDGRAQSNVIGYVILFSVALLALGVIVAAGTTALAEIQSATNADSGEATIQSVAVDIDALYQGTATSRTTPLELGSAGLTTGPVTSTNVTARAHGEKVVLNRSYRPVVYETENTAFVYENTLVVRDQRRGAVALERPLLIASPERAVIPVVETNAWGPQSVAGGSRRFRAELNDTSARSLSSDTGDTVEVNVTIQTVPDRADVWGRQLNETFEGMTRPGTTEPVCQPLRPSALSCVFETDRVVISHANVRYEFE